MVQWRWDRLENSPREVSEAVSARGTPTCSDIVSRCGRRIENGRGRTTCGSRLHKVPAANGHQPAPGRQCRGAKLQLVTPQRLRGAKATVLDCMGGDGEGICAS